MMATQINHYLPVLSSLPRLHFVTLTLPTIEEGEIKERLELMQKKWRKITDQARKYREGFRGIRKLEIKPSRRRGEYHPHYHILIEGEANAEWLVSQWLRLNPNASPKAQDVREVTNPEVALIELFKYTTKLVCADNAGNEVVASAESLDVIFTNLYRKRIYQTFGGIRKMDEEAMEMDVEVFERARGLYKWIGHDWFHTRWGHALSEWNPASLEINLEGWKR